MATVFVSAYTLIGVGVMKVMVCSHSTRQGVFCLPFLLLLSVLLVSPLTSVAQPPEAEQQTGQVDDPQAAPGPVNQRQALERVRARYPGNVISINEVRQGNQVRYRVRIDNDGNIFTVFVDQATGRVTRE